MQFSIQHDGSPGGQILGSKLQMHQGFSIALGGLWNILTLNHPSFFSVSPHMLEPVNEKSVIPVLQLQCFEVLLSKLGEHACIPTSLNRFRIFLVYGHWSTAAEI